MKTYYKVVKTDLTSRYAEGKAEVQYKVGEYVCAPSWLPEEHKVLFVFKSLRSAKNFVQLMLISSGVKIYECKVKKIERLPRYLETSYLADGEIVFLSNWFPSGTEAVREVKLMRKICLDWR